jgi:salicylate hydroxylase
VLERRPAFHEDGAGIQIGPTGTRILRQLGVADALRPHVGVPEAISVRDGRSGRELTRLPLGRWIAMRHGAPYWVVHRKDLHTTLLQAARAEPLVAMSMGFDAADSASNDSAVAIATDTGDAWTGRALVAADGLWSPIRARHFDALRPSFAGKSAVRSVVPLSELPDDLRVPHTVIWLFPDAHVVHYPVSGGTQLAIVAVLADTHDDAEWSAPVPPAWVHHNMPECAEALATVILQADTWKKWALHTLPVPRALAHGPVALLGDAAHPVTPFLAQGGVLALEDAAVLAAMLARQPDDVPAALGAYEKCRRRRAMRVANASRRNGRIYHMAGLAAAMRNLVLRFTPPQRLMARYDWLYGWRAE